MLALLQHVTKYKSNIMYFTVNSQLCHKAIHVDHLNGSEVAVTREKASLIFRLRSLTVMSVVFVYENSAFSSFIGIFVLLEVQKLPPSLANAWVTPQHGGGARQVQTSSHLSSTLSCCYIDHKAAECCGKVGLF